MSKHIKEYTKEELEEIVNTCDSYLGVLRKLDIKLGIDIPKRKYTKTNQLVPTVGI